MLQRTILSTVVASGAHFPERTAAGLGEVPAVSLVRGREAILAAQPLLTELAVRCGQSSELESLRYVLSTEDARKKLPWLVMIGRAAPGGLLGAVVIFEYKTRLGRTRVFATADATGRRAVIAPREQRARMAAVAAQALMTAGARVVHLAFSETHGAPEGAWDGPGAGEAAGVVAEALGGAEWLLTKGEMPLYLPLYETFDRTLARIGQRTRSNLRYYRRRSELDLGSRFVARAEVSREEFLAFNRECSFAVSDELAAWRHGTLREHRNTMLRGVQDGQGRWLSLVGMRGHGRQVEIDWQMNRADLPAYSLGTVMRSYLIEHEIGRGTTRLYIEGGTPQPIGRSFLKERVAELTVRRRSVAVWLLQRFARRVFPAKNRLAQILGDRGAAWVTEQK